MPNHYHSELVKKSTTNPARIMKMTTPHGEVTTPAFMPVGTRAVINHLLPSDIAATRSEIILGGNTYHMLVSPGTELIQKLGGMHKFMGWDKAMLTDSGGYQVFSLSKNGKICVIDDHGAHFRHPITGAVIHMTPETSIQTQKIIGADIIMAFDECTPEEGGREAALSALDRTHRWLMQSKAEHEKNPNSAYGFKQALFGIIQGGSHRDLREQSMEFILNMDLDGIAIGGEVIGFNMEKTGEILDWLVPHLPEEKIRYTMGVGLGPQDLIDVVAKGVDVFDCVAPTRNARHGTLYCGKITRKDGWLVFESNEDRGRILIKKAIYKDDNSPIMEGCGCYTCQNFSRAYLHFLYKGEMQAYCHLACIHNVYVMQDVCIQMREEIMRN